MLSYFECDLIRVVTNRGVIELMYFLCGLGLHRRAGFKSQMESKQLKLNFQKIIMYMISSGEQKAEEWGNIYW